MGINAVISFLLELGAIVIYAWSPFQYLHVAPVLKLGITILAIIGVIILWARFAAPRSSKRLIGVQLLLLKALIFIPAVFLIGLKISSIFLTLSLVVVAANLVIEYTQGSRPTR